MELIIFLSVFGGLALIGIIWSSIYIYIYKYNKSKRTNETE